MSLSHSYSTPVVHYYLWKLKALERLILNVRLGAVVSVFSRLEKLAALPLVIVLFSKKDGVCGREKITTRKLF